MGALASDRQKWMFGILVIASFYSAAIGEGVYLYSLLLFLLSVLVAASIFGRIATAATLVVSCLVVAYFVIPPVFSFRMEGWELLFFVVYVSAALIGCAVMQFRRHASHGRQASSDVQAKTIFAVTFDSEGGLHSTSSELLTFTGKRRNQVEGFQWLSCVSPHDRRRLVEVIQRGKGELRCQFIDVTRTHRSLNVSVESRYPSDRLFRRTVMLTVTEIAD